MNLFICRAFFVCFAFLSMFSMAEPAFAKCARHGTIFAECNLEHCTSGFSVMFRVRHCGDPQSLIEPLTEDDLNWVFSSLRDSGTIPEAALTSESKIYNFEPWGSGEEYDYTVSDNARIEDVQHDWEKRVFYRDLFWDSFVALDIPVFLLCIGVILYSGRTFKRKYLDREAGVRDIWYLPLAFWVYSILTFVFRFPCADMYFLDFLLIPVTLLWIGELLALAVSRMRRKFRQRES